MNNVAALEKAMTDVGADYQEDIYHHFSHGVYSREMRMKADDLIVGKQHKHSCTNFLMSGHVIVTNNGGDPVQYIAPFVFVSPANTKRAMYAVTDVTWVTVHPNVEQTLDVDRLESQIIVDRLLEEL